MVPQSHIKSGTRRKKLTRCKKRVGISELLRSCEASETFDTEIQQIPIPASKTIKTECVLQYLSYFAFSVIEKVNLDLRL